jgi:hypothetical protein
MQDAIFEPYIRRKDYDTQELEKHLKEEISLGKKRRIAPQRTILPGYSIFFKNQSAWDSPSRYPS